MAWEGTIKEESRISIKTKKTTQSLIKIIDKETGINK